MPVINPGALDYQDDELTAADFNAGINDDTSISAGNVGIVAVAEVGEDGKLSNYGAVVLGQEPRSVGGDNRGNEIYVKLQAGGADVADSVQFQFQARKKAQLSGRPLTPWIKHRGQDQNDPRLRKSLLANRGAVDGEEIILVVKNESGAVTVDLSESEFEIPIMGGN